MSRPEHLPQGNVRPRSFSRSVLENGNARCCAKSYQISSLYTKKLEEKNYTKIIAFDETAVWFDAVGSTTVDRVGVENVPIASTGHV